MANVELLDKVMKHIEHNEHLWNQNYWAAITVNGWSGEELKKFILDDPQNPICGTQRCFAGHAVAFSGWTPIFEIEDWMPPAHLKDGLAADWCVNKQGDKRRIPALATELLEITAFDAHTLFAPNNDLDDLRNMVTYLKQHGSLDGVQCPECKGSGETWTECYACGHDTTETCGTCEGSGEVGYNDS